MFDTMGGWPVVESESWNDHLWSWQMVIQHFEVLGFSMNHVYDISIDVDMKNSSRRIIYVRFSHKMFDFN